MKYTNLLEHDGETLATTLERGRNKLNDWYEGFLAGFEGNQEQKDRSSDFMKGFRKGRTVANQKIMG